MKVAGKEDLIELSDMAMKFLAETDYGEFSEKASIDAVIENIVMSEGNEKIIILEPKVGFIAGYAAPFPFGPHRVANELAWYIYPDYRGKNIGPQLLQAFEYWAKEKAGCKLINMVSLNDRLDEFYTNNGYKLYERAYVKAV